MTTRLMLASAALCALTSITACEAEGPLGDPGESGIDGEDGANGSDGMDGADGMDGQLGMAGESCWDASGDGICNTADEDINGDGECDFLDCQGEPGEVGLQGDPGAKGDVGNTGPQGPAGPQGPVGPTGPQGAKGNTGNTGPQGAQGAKGDKGNKGNTGNTGPQGLPGSGAGTFFRHIDAQTCVPQGHSNIGDKNGSSNSSCTTTNTVRTNGSDHLPCIVRADNLVLQTWVCDLALPSGALIEEVILYGNDNDPLGYFEGAVWRSSSTSFSIGYVSSFGGVWQSSGVATATTGTTITAVPLFLDSASSHTVSTNYSYSVGIAMYKGPSSAGLWLNGVRVKYTIQ